MDPRTGFPLNCRMPSLLGDSEDDNVHHAHTHNTGTVWGKINQQNRQHARAFCGYRTCENPRIYPQTPPGMLPVSSILPLSLPQTSSHQTQGNSRVARMEHQTHSGSPRIPETQSAGTLWFPSGLAAAGNVCSGRNNYYRRTGNLIDRMPV